MSDELRPHNFYRHFSRTGPCWRCIWCGIEAQDDYAELIGLDILNLMMPCPIGEVDEVGKLDG